MAYRLSRNTRRHNDSFRDKSPGICREIRNTKKGDSGA
jgi:hypothetical protein